MFGGFKLGKKNYEKLIFIVGSPRSGTTWLWGLLTSTEGFIPLDRTDFDPSNPSIVDGKRITSETGAFMNYSPQFVKEVVDSKISQNPDKYIVEKTPKHIYHLQDINKTFPTSKIIFLVRDPRAVISSMMNSKFVEFASSLDDAIIQYKDAYGAMENFEKDHNNQESMRIKYEDMKEDTGAVFTDILSFIGLQSDKFDIEKIIEENRNVSKVKMEGVFRKGEIDSYKNDLTEDDIVKIERDLGDIMEKLGYS